MSYPPREECCSDTDPHRRVLQSFGRSNQHQAYWNYRNVLVQHKLLDLADFEAKAAESI